MARRLVDVTLENLRQAPPETLRTVYWELDVDEPAVEPEFEKEEWFSGVLLEWGSCGKLALEDDLGAVAFAQFAPPRFFPRLGRFRAGRVSSDAVYLSYCYVVDRRRGFGVGTQLVRTIARDLVERGILAVEAIGDRAWTEGWVLPAPFLGAAGFEVLREDPRFPLMRLDLRTAILPEEAAEAAAAPLPAPGAA
ncbi:MAG TPA: GNAT family N-acetyltransferase [Actinomycetota bacterium]|nr:GNAT family N-acetyltransferase [Actinomycetota bacterium]